MSEVLLTKDGKRLDVALSRALFQEKIRALLLIAPLLIFILVTFVIPIFNMLTRSVENHIVEEVMPLTVAELELWDAKSGEAPPEALYAAFAKDMSVAVEEKQHTLVGKRLNYDIAGSASKFRKLSRTMKDWDIENGTDFKAKFIEADEDWGSAEYWGKVKAYSSPYTLGYFANAIDGELTPDGFQFKPKNERFLLKLFWTTFWMSGVITFLTFALGYPVAWLLANIKDSTANLLMILVLLPFWTSLLVRTAAWKVNLQDSGVLNSMLIWMNEKTTFLFNGAPYELMYNRFGVIISMTHILLPFMILPLYSVMKTIDPSYLRAAKSLGASNWTAFWRVYFPQCMSGIGAGAILVFILAVGYYITPAIMGGTEGRFISNMIAHHVKDNQGLAAALGAILLVVVLGLYYIYDRIVGIDKVKLG